MRWTNRKLVLEKRQKTKSTATNKRTKKRAVLSGVLFIGKVFTLNTVRAKSSSTVCSRFHIHSEHIIDNHTPLMCEDNSNKDNMSVMTLRMTVSDVNEDETAFCVEEKNKKMKITTKNLLDMADCGRTFLPCSTGSDDGLWMNVVKELHEKDKNRIVAVSKSALNPSYTYNIIMTLFAAMAFEMNENLVQMFMFSYFHPIFQKITLLALLSFLAYVTTLACNFAVTHGDFGPSNDEQQTSKATTLLVHVEKWDFTSNSENYTMVQNPKSAVSLRGGAFVPDEINAEEKSDKPKVDYPVRFLRAAKGDPIHGRVRYEQTMEWRKENRIDSIVDEPFIFYELIKKNYPQYFHLRGLNNEPVYYEKPSKINLKNLKAGGMVMEDLLRYYMLVTEYMWEKIERNDESRCIYVLDLEGLGVFDFMGEVVDFVKKCAILTGDHYPERSGTIFVVNVPSWFNVIWKVVSPLCDPVTQQKVRILRGKENILKDFLTRISIENIPPNYGGKSMPLGESPEEEMFRQDMIENVEKAGLYMV